MSAMNASNACIPVSLMRMEIASGCGPSCSCRRHRHFMIARASHTTPHFTSSFLEHTSKRPKTREKYLPRVQACSTRHRLTARSALDRFSTCGDHVSRKHTRRRFFCVSHGHLHLSTEVLELSPKSQLRQHCRDWCTSWPARSATNT